VVDGKGACHYCGEQSSGRKWCGSRCEARARRGCPVAIACEGCGKSFAPRDRNRTCSSSCAAQRDRKVEQLRRDTNRLTRSGACERCGQVWDRTGRPGGSARFCTEDCWALYRRERGLDARGHKHRAIKYGAVYQYVNPIVVLDRDKWTCQLCGERTPKSKRGTSHPKAPEIDHIVPISLGGPHSVDNLQCACRSCNASKNAKWRGQRRIDFSGAQQLHERQAIDG
jgi:hypothetical protein